jgi:nitrogen-specific signal transduction histidine kinase
VAHDINNYLAAIRAQCELMLRKELPAERRREKLSAAVGTVDRASTLIQRLLAFARRQPAHPEVVDLNRIVRELGPMLDLHLGENVRLEMELADAPCRTLIDPAQVEQILVNLVVNARDAMPSGGTPGHRNRPGEALRRPHGERRGSAPGRLGPAHRRRYRRRDFAGDPRPHLRARFSRRAPSRGTAAWVWRRFTASWNRTAAMSG